RGTGEGSRLSNGGGKRQGDEGSRNHCGDPMRRRTTPVEGTEGTGDGEGMTHPAPGMPGLAGGDKGPGLADHSLSSLPLALSPQCRASERARSLPTQRGRLSLFRVAERDLAAPYQICPYMCTNAY